MNIKISDLLFEENNSDSIHEVFENNNSKASINSNKRKRSKLIYEQDEKNLNKQQLAKLSAIVSPKIAAKFDNPETLKKIIEDKGIGLSGPGVDNSGLTKAKKIQGMTFPGGVMVNIFNIYDAKPDPETGGLPLASQNDLKKYAELGIICCELISQGEIISGENSQGKNIREFFVMPFPGFAVKIDDKSKDLVKLHSEMFGLDFGDIDEKKLKENPMFMHLGVGKKLHDFPIVETPPPVDEKTGKPKVGELSTEVAELQGALRNGLLSKIAKYEQKSNLGSARSTVTEIGSQDKDKEKSTKTPETPEKKAVTPEKKAVTPEITSESFVHNHSLTSLLFEKKSLNKLHTKQKKVLVENYFNVDYSNLNNFEKRDFYFVTKLLIEEEYRNSRILLNEEEIPQLGEPQTEEEAVGRLAKLKKFVKSSAGKAYDKVGLKKLVDKAKAKVEKLKQDIDTARGDLIPVESADGEAQAFIMPGADEEADEFDEGDEEFTDDEVDEESDLESDNKKGSSVEYNSIKKDYLKSIKDPMLKKLMSSKSALNQEIDEMIQGALEYKFKIPKIEDIYEDIVNDSEYTKLNDNKAKTDLENYKNEIIAANEKFKDTVGKEIKVLEELKNYDPEADTTTLAQLNIKINADVWYEELAKTKIKSGVDYREERFNEVLDDLGRIRLLEEKVMASISVLARLESAILTHAALQETGISYDAIELSDEEGNLSKENSTALRVHSISKEFGMSVDDIKSMLMQDTNESITIKNKNLLSESSKKEIVKLRKKIVVDVNGHIDPSSLRAVFDDLENDSNYKKLRKNFIARFKARMGKSLSSASEPEIAAQLSTYFDEMLTSGAGTYSSGPGASSATPVGVKNPSKLEKIMATLKKTGKWALILGTVTLAGWGIYDWFANGGKTTIKILQNAGAIYGTKIIDWAEALGAFGTPGGIVSSGGAGVAKAALMRLCTGSAGGSPPAGIFTGVLATFPVSWTSAWSGISSAIKGGWKGLVGWFKGTGFYTWATTTAWTWIKAPFGMTLGAGIVHAFPILSVFFTGIAAGLSWTAGSIISGLGKLAVSAGWAKASAFVAKGASIKTWAAASMTTVLKGAAAVGWFGVGTAVLLAALVAGALYLYFNKKKKGVDKKISHMLKIYVLAAALNKNVKEICDLLGVDVSEYLAEMSKNVLPTDSEIKVVFDEYTGAKAVSSGWKRFWAGSGTPSLSKSAEDIDTVEKFEKFIENFKFFVESLNEDNVIKSSTTKILEEVAESLEKDLTQFKAKMISEDDLLTHYSHGMATKIIYSYLTGNRDNLAITDINKFSLLDSKEAIIESLQASRNKELQSLRGLGKGFKISDDPINNLVAQIVSSEKDKISGNINLAKIVEDFGKRLSDDSIDTKKIINGLRANHGHIAANNIKRFSSEGWVEAIPGVSDKLGQKEYAKKFFEAIHENLASGIESLVDTGVLEESRLTNRSADLLFEINKARKLSLIYDSTIKNKNLLNEASIASVGASIGKYLGFGGGATFYGAAKLMANYGASALIPAKKVTMIVGSLKAAMWICAAIAVGYMAVSTINMIIDMAQEWSYVANTNPYEDERYVKAISEYVRTVAKVRVGLSYAKVILQHKEALEKLGIKVIGEDSQIFGDFKSKVDNMVQTAKLKRNLDNNGKTFRAIIEDAIYQTINANSPGIGEFLNESFIQMYVDKVCFEKSSPLSPIFEKFQKDKKEDKSGTTAESFVYRKGLGLLLEADEKEEDVIAISLNKAYKQTLDITKEMLYSSVDLNGAVNNKILDNIKPHFEHGIFSRKKLWQQRWGSRDKFMKQTVSNAMRMVTHIPEQQCLSILYSKKSKTTQGQEAELATNLELSHRDRFVHNSGLGVLLENNTNLLKEVDQLLYVKKLTTGNFQYFYKTDSALHTADPFSTLTVDSTGKLVVGVTRDATDVTRGFNHADNVMFDANVKKLTSTLNATYDSAGDPASGIGGLNLQSPATPPTIVKPIVKVTPPPKPTLIEEWAVDVNKFFSDPNVLLFMQAVSITYLGTKIVKGLASTPITAKNVVPLVADIDWARLVKLKFSAIIIKMLELYREPLKKNGIHVKGSLPAGVKNALSAARSDFTGSGGSEEATALASAMQKRLEKRPGLGKYFGKDGDKQIVKFLEDDVTDTMYAYHKAYRTETYNKIFDATEKSMQTGGIKKADAYKDSMTRAGLLGMGGGAIAIKSAMAAATLAGPAGWLLVAGIGTAVAGAGAYANRMEGYDSRQMLSGEESIDAERSVIKKMLDKEVKKFIKAMLDLSRKVKGIKESLESLMSKNSLAALLVESEIKSSSISVEDFIKVLKGNEIMAYSGDIKRGTSEYNDAVSYTIDIAAAQLSNICGIEVDGVEKYSNPATTSQRVVAAACSSPEPASVPQGEEFSPSLAAAAISEPPPQMNQPCNSTQFMGQMNKTGGPAMMTVIPSIVQGVIEKNNGQMPKGFDWNKFFEALDNGEFTTEQAVNQVAGAIDKMSSKQKSISGSDFTEAFEQVVSASIDGKPEVNKSDMITVFKQLQTIPLIIKTLDREDEMRSLLELTTSGKEIFNSGKPNARMKNFVNNYVAAYFNILDDDEKLDNYEEDKIQPVRDALHNSLFARTNPDDNILTIVSSRATPATSFANSNQIDSFMLHDILMNVVTRIVNSSLGVTVSTLDIEKELTDTVTDAGDRDYLRSVNNIVKGIKSKVKNESRVTSKRVIRNKRRTKPVLQEDYLIGSLSNLLFENSLPIEESNKTIKTNINLSREWLKIWDI